MFANRPSPANSPDTKFKPIWPKGNLDSGSGAYLSIAALIADTSVPNLSSSMLP